MPQLSFPKSDNALHRCIGDGLVTPSELRVAIAQLPAHQPVTERYEAALRARQPTRASYPTQKDHWLGWLADYSGSGFYHRANWNRSARFVYNR